MKKISFVAIFSVLLLAGCGVSRPAGGWATCECERTVKVPDGAFRAWLVENGYAEKAGWKRLKPTEEGCRLKEMECFGQGIESLEGIEMFPQLEQLTCSDNPIEELDLNGLPNLERLYALNVPLQRLEMDSCHHLKRVQISYTKLSAVDLAPFPELELLLFIFSPLTEINLTPCVNLKQLYIRGTEIREVDLRPCAKLLELHALDTPLETIIVSEEQYGSEIKVSVDDSVRIEVR
jgi:Leucine-rich repeat (LRR) protein